MAAKINCVDTEQNFATCHPMHNLRQRIRAAQTLKQKLAVVQDWPIRESATSQYTSVTTAAKQLPAPTLEVDQLGHRPIDTSRVQCLSLIFYICYGQNNVAYALGISTREVILAVLEVHRPTNVRGSRFAVATK